MFFQNIRQQKTVDSKQKWLHPLLVIVSGLSLGIISKILDETASNELPFFLEAVDIGNYLSRMGIWLFLALVLAIYSRTPFRAALHVLLFFTSMVSSYYLYTIYVAGFYPKSYMMIWIFMAAVSPFLAIFCWFAKSKGWFSVIILAFIVLFMSRQAFAFGFWYFDIRYLLEFILFLMTLIVLYQSPKQIIKVIAIGMALFFLTAQIPLYGML